MGPQHEYHITHTNLILNYIMCRNTESETQSGWDLVHVVTLVLASTNNALCSMFRWSDVRQNTTICFSYPSSLISVVTVSHVSSQWAASGLNMFLLVSGRDTGNFHWVYLPNPLLSLSLLHYHPFLCLCIYSMSVRHQWRNEVHLLTYCTLVHFGVSVLFEYSTPLHVLSNLSYELLCRLCALKSEWYMVTCLYVLKLNNNNIGYILKHLYKFLYIKLIRYIF